MRFVKSFGRARFIVAALILACAGVAGIGMWRGSAFQRTKQPVQKLTDEQVQAAARARIQRGVGDQVRLAAPGESDRKVRASVDAAAGFIYQRSNLYMSESTKVRFAQAEQKVINGRGHRLSTDELIDTLTEVVATRLTTLSDADVERAASIYRPNADGEITVRSDGRWGYLTKDALVQQVKVGRTWSQRGDVSLRTALRSMIDQDVKARLETLSVNAPAQFGDVERQGLTPVQALLLAYSVAVDDPLEGSQSDLRESIVQERMLNGAVRPTQKQQRISNKAYGVNGFLQSSPGYLFFDKAAVSQLLNRAEGGQK